MKSLIILPSYNEARNVEKIITALKKTSKESDILVVDDNSPDGTARLVEDLQITDKNIFLLKRPKKEGLGPAYIEAFKWAKERGYDKILTMDCDFSHSPET